LLTTPYVFNEADAKAMANAAPTSWFAISADHRGAIGGRPR